MFRPRRVLVLATRRHPILTTALVAALEKSGFLAAIDPPGCDEDEPVDVVIRTETIGSMIAVPKEAADFLVLLLRDDVASLTSGFMTLKAALGARGPHAAPCFVAMLVDEPTTTLAARQAHRSLNRAAKRFLRLDLIHNPDIEADDEKIRAVARSLARRIGAKLRLHQSSRRRDEGTLRASG